MKNTNMNDEGPFDEDLDALEMDTLISRFPDRANEIPPNPFTEIRYNMISNLLRAAVTCALRFVRTHKRHSIVKHRAAHSTNTSFPSRVYTTLRPLRLRPRRLIFFSLLILIWTPVVLLALVLAYGGIPPDYSEVKRWERELPQHVWTRSEVNHTSGKLGRRGNNEGIVDDGRLYLRFPDHLWGHGLNNVLQEALLTSHLAHRTRRSFVFEDYTWSHLPLPYTLYDFALRPTRVPLGAFVGGWIVGGGVTDGGQGQGVVEEHGSGVRSGSTPMSRASDGIDEVSDGHVPGLTRSGSSTELSSTTISTSARAAIEERRAVSAEYFEYVCPPSRRREICSGRDVLPVTKLNESHRPDGNQDSATVTDVFTLHPLSEEAAGHEILDWWIRRLQQPDLRDEPCVVIREEQQRVFDSNFFGSTRILSLFDDLKRSPVLQGFTWSPLVHHALQRTMSRFFGENITSTLPSVTGSQAVSTSSSYTITPQISASPTTSPLLTASSSPPIISGLLAVHLRRGDFKRHCLRLAEWHAGYMGFNRFDGMLDTFDVEAHLQSHNNTFDVDSEENGDPGNTLPVDERRKAYYLVHCLPTIQQIVQRLHDVREEYQHPPDAPRGREAPQSAEYALRNVYVLTNGWSGFVDELRAALLADGWGRVIGTPQLEDVDVVDGAGTSFSENHQNVPGRRSLPATFNSLASATACGLTREEKGVSVALDMGFAERAEVFVGNGFSSLSSNIVMLRMAKGMPVSSSRLL